MPRNSRMRLFAGRSFVGLKHSMPCLVFLLGCSATAFGQRNLPQSNDKIALSSVARRSLEATLAEASGSKPVPFSPEAAKPIIASLPKDFRNSCNDVVEQWPGAQDTDLWAVRVLFSLRNEGRIEAVLALRCESSNTDMKEWYDERPAVVELTHESATLRLVPIAKDCEGCAPLYHVEFSKTYEAMGARLVELGAYLNENPCCGGPDSKSANRLVVLSLLAAEQVLSLDKGTYADSNDDEDGSHTEWVCEAKIAYLRDAAGKVEMLSAETRCTVNKKPQPEVKKQSFRWNATAGRFEEVN